MMHHINQEWPAYGVPATSGTGSLCGTWQTGERTSSPVVDGSRKQSSRCGRDPREASRVTGWAGQLVSVGLLLLNSLKIAYLNKLTLTLGQYVFRV